MNFSINLDVSIYTYISKKVIINQIMPRESRFSIAQKEIEDYFEMLDSKVLTIAQLEGIFQENRVFWRLPVSWHVHKFKAALETQTKKFRTLSFEFSKRSYNRFIWDNPSAFQIALTLGNSAYLSHYSAIFFHGLTDQIPKTIFITNEQSSKGRESVLTQTGIDSAFSKPQRISRNLSKLDENQVINMLLGKSTGQLGVDELENDIRVTNLERTLIDVTVRPLYSGGVYEVLEAYRRAADLGLSVNRLTAYLRKINHTYPYHQAIGFYLEKSGAYKESQIALLQRFDFEYDFYLTYNMKEKEYSEKWRLYYPKGF